MSDHEHPTDSCEILLFDHRLPPIVQKWVELQREEVQKAQNSLHDPEELSRLTQLVLSAVEDPKPKLTLIKGELADDNDNGN